MAGKISDIKNSLDKDGDSDIVKNKEKDAIRSILRTLETQEGQTQFERFLRNQKNSAR